ncbi:C40 family peptidase [Paenibacillus bouchesdurhonensis]|uniref:C40 family peptidase n=1 Tax=Paenibacillus bouchesdurhonensis TaxID=1870990 RepID=UPI000DA625EE|nr:SH3 domain-containing C40 family peptidase [Paenibacillus bouchesdurhonensis]
MKRSVAILLSSAIALSIYSAMPAATTAAASQQSAAQSGLIEAGVNLRDKPSMSGKVIGFLKKGTAVQVLEESNGYFYKVKDAKGKTGYVSAAPKYITVQGTATKPEASNEWSGRVIYGVNLRSLPSTSGKVIKMLKKGTRVTILEESNKSFYKVRTDEGLTGYVSSSNKYMEISGEPASQPSVPANIKEQVDQVIRTGKKYLGTPYEFGSNRNTTTTFDCSDFVRHIYKEALGITLPSDSRKQGAWIKENSQPVYRISDLKAGDLVFFMSYKGSSASAYKGIDKNSERITHVAMYIGDGQLLQTYSVKSGGVRIDKLSGSWEHRFLFGGSVLQ